MDPNEIQTIQNHPVWGNCLQRVSLPGGGTGTVTTIECIPHVLWNLIGAASTFAGIVALAFVIWGGYKLVFSGGDPKQIEGARHTIMYAIIGLILVFLSVFIVRFIAVVTGVECLNLNVFGFHTCI